MFDNEIDWVRTDLIHLRIGDAPDETRRKAGLKLRPELPVCTSDQFEKITRLSRTFPE
jgi:hypothetical protein